MGDPGQRRFAFAAVGTVVGAYFSNPALGYAIGSALGGALFPDDPLQSQSQGPQLGDLRVSSSAYGAPIPEGFGTMRMSSNMIWSSGIREVSTTTTTEGEGGKGGGSGPTHEQTTYTYFADASFAFAQGPAEAILRVWADNKVIYDFRDPFVPVPGSTADLLDQGPIDIDSRVTMALFASAAPPPLIVREYLGTATQNPCPTISAAEGAANTPAFRGTVYITLEGLDLTDFGNRIPQIMAEVAFKATASRSGRLSIDSGITDFNDAGAFHYDWQRMLVYTIDAAGATRGIRVWSLITLQEVRSQLEADIGLSGTLGAIHISHVGQHSGHLYTTTDALNEIAIDIIDADSLVRIGTAGVNAVGFNDHGIFISSGLPKIALLDHMAEAGVISAGPVTGGGPAERIFLLGHASITDGPVLLDVTNPAGAVMLFWDNTPSITQSRHSVSAPTEAQQATFWTLHHPGGNTNITIVRRTIQFVASVTCDLSTGICQSTGVEANNLTVFTPDIWENDAVGGSTAWGPVYDHTDGKLIFGMATTLTNNSSTVWKYDPVLDTVQWVLKGVPSQVFGDKARFSQYTRVRNGRLGIANGSQLESENFAVIDTINGTIVDSGLVEDDFGPWWGISGVVWDDTMFAFTSDHNTAANSLEQFFVGRKTGAGETLSSVVSTLAGENVNGAGLAASEFDVTELVNDTVRGYAVTRQMSVRAALAPLFAAYDFDAMEADDKIKFVKRGAASVASIVQSDIVAAAAEAAVVPETRTQEVELPGILDLGYLDIAIDYQNNIATAKRSRTPVPTMYSLDSRTLNLAIVFTAAEAKEIAERLLYTAWSQRRQLAFPLGRNFIKLVPTDVITLTLDSGATFKLQIVEADIGVNYIQTYKAVIQDATLQVLSGATADSSLGFEEDRLSASFNTRLCLIDAPYLRDIDATGRTSIELKFAMAGYLAGWESGTLWDSADGLSYSPIARSTAPKAYGIVTNKLPTGMKNLTDTTTQLTVSMIEGELSSVTDAQFIASEQAAIIGSPALQNWEYVTFRDVSQAATGVYTVSHLMRGRRGTDAPEISDSHNLGEFFIVADRATISRVLLPLSNFNVLRFYKGVGRDDFLENADVVPLASKGRPLTPHRPHQLTALVDGSNNIDFTWARSARVNFELTNNASWNDGPLEEDSESYEVDILVQPGGAVVRTIAVVAEAAEYTKAQLIADLAAGTGVTTLNVGSTTTFTRPAGDFTTDGFLAGMTIETAGFTDGANNGVFTIDTVAAATITVLETTLVAESGTADEQIDAIREDDITFKIYQISAQVIRGFASAEITIAL